MASDMEILKKAYDIETDVRRPKIYCHWERYSVGASSEDIKNLLDEGLIEYSSRTGGYTRYKLTKKGHDLVWATQMEYKYEKVPAESLLNAMDLIVGFDDIKQTIAQAIESQRRIHFLLSGPPACSKSLILEAVRSTVTTSYIAFGSRTSASGLSDALFENRPSILLLDECDKMDMDCYSVMLGVMEGGEILETKSRKTRGIKLNTSVIAACNSTVKMPREFMSRFALHIHFPEYTRQEFVDVCRGFLSRAEGCPPEIATLLGEKVYDLGIGDVRKARGAWQIMTAPTEVEVERVIGMMLKYGTDNRETDQRKKKVAQQRLM